MRPHRIVTRGERLEERHVRSYWALFSALGTRTELSFVRYQDVSRVHVV